MLVYQRVTNMNRFAINSTCKLRINSTHRFCSNNNQWVTKKRWILGKMNCCQPSTGWWFGTFFIFPNSWNDDPIWLIFFRGVETTNQSSIGKISDWDLANKDFGEINQENRFIADMLGQDIEWCSGTSCWQKSARIKIEDYTVPRR